jgi:DNA-binding CsgD family transcriptional regulator
MTRVHGGLPARLPARLARAGVTEREAEVLSAVAERLRNREIADRLYISVRTVESHISALLRKLDVTDRAALVEVGAEISRAAQLGTALSVPLTSIDDAGHLPHVEQPDAFLDALAAATAQ